jgi:quercetin dioxygenase-like cupin family protein
MFEKRESKEQEHLNGVDRRSAILLSLLGASTLAAGKVSPVLAEDQPADAPEGVTERVVTEIDSVFPEFKKVRLVEVTWEPGAKSGPHKMPHHMICEMSQGTLDEIKDGRPVTRKTGDVWTCRIGEVDEDANNGTTPATMRIFTLMNA